MADDDRLLNLMFLLGLAPLVAGCAAPDDDDQLVTTAASGATSTSATATGQGADGPASGDDAMSTASASDDPTSPTGEATMGTSNGGPMTTGDAGDTMDDSAGELDCSDPPAPAGPISDDCTTYVDLINECVFGGTLSMDCLGYYSADCQVGLEAAMRTQPECATALEEMLACVSPLDCRGLTSAGPCADEFDAVDAACPRR